MLVDAYAAGVHGAGRRGARDLFRGRVLAITGSAGKTTTKELLGAAASARYGTRVLATPANENNEIGVSKLLLAAVERRARRDRRRDGRAALRRHRHARRDRAARDRHSHQHRRSAPRDHGLARARSKRRSGRSFRTGARAVLNARRCGVAPARAVRLRSRRIGLPRTRRRRLPIRTARATALSGRTHRRRRRRRRAARARDRRARSRRAQSREPRGRGRRRRSSSGVDLELDAGAIASCDLPEGRYERSSSPAACGSSTMRTTPTPAASIAALDAFAQEPARAAHRGARQHGRARRRSRTSCTSASAAHAADKGRRACWSAASSPTRWRAAPDAQGSPRSASCASATNPEAARWLRANARERRRRAAQRLAHVQVGGNRRGVARVSVATRESRGQTARSTARHRCDSRAYAAGRAGRRS